MASKSDIYRKAAEIITRDGRTRGALWRDIHARGSLELQLDPSGTMPVCAIGACARAEYELTGFRLHESDTTDAWDYVDRHGFATDSLQVPSIRPKVPVWEYNDVARVTDQDVINALTAEADRLEYNGAE